MTPVDQTIVDANYGNCLQAVVASLLNLPLEAVPHFIMSEELWFDVYTSFLWAHGWNFVGTVSDLKATPLDISKTINGYVHASVISSMFPSAMHAVVMDVNGVVVHDPNPNKFYQGKTIYGTDSFMTWESVSRRTDGWSDYSHVKMWLRRNESRGKTHAFSSSANT